MPCRGCSNLQCSCFVSNSDSTTTVGNGSQHAPYTFRPNYVPFPRPFGHLYGITDQSLDGAPYSLFEVRSTFDIDEGGIMNTGNRTSLTASADGVYLVGFFLKFAAPATGDLIDQFSIRKNSSIQVTSGSFNHNASVTAGTYLVMSSVTLLDLNTGDTLDLFVERVSGAGTITVDFDNGGDFSFNPHLWAFWMGGAI